MFETQGEVEQPLAVAVEGRIVEAAPVEPGLRHPAAHDGLLRPWPARISAMVSDFRAGARVRGPVPAVIEAPGRVQRPAAFERRREQAGMAGHRVAFGKAARRVSRTGEQDRPGKAALGLARGRS